MGMQRVRSCCGTSAILEFGFFVRERCRMFFGGFAWHDGVEDMTLVCKCQTHARIQPGKPGCNVAC